MATVYYDKDADVELIKGRKVAVIGYGSQGHAHALNLQDSGMDVRVGLREGSPSWERAELDGLRVLETGKAALEANVVMMLVPDQRAPDVFETSIRENLESGDSLAFAHGFNVHFGQLTAPESCDVFMIAPKGPG